MPHQLLHRCGGRTSDTIASFRRAARRRYDDARHAAESGDRERRTVAIYLWGYAVEMTLKAGFFRAAGYGDDQLLTVNLPTIRGILSQLGDRWEGANLHAVAEWGRVLAVARTHQAVAAPMSPPEASEVVRRSAEVGEVWAEWLRYHANVAYPAELRRMQRHADWFVQRFDVL